jgi:hypothetical protein
VTSTLSQLAPEISQKVARKKRAMTVAGSAPLVNIFIKTDWPLLKKPIEGIPSGFTSQEPVKDMDIPVTQAIPMR